MHFNTPKLWKTDSSAPFVVTHAKVGRGPLKAGGEVISEAEIVHAQVQDRRFVVAWQNLLGPPTNTNLKPVAAVIEKTINEYLKP